jgi:hypothetical protein
MIVSKSLMHQCGKVLRHTTMLATRTPISLDITVEDGEEFQYEAWDPPKRLRAGRPIYLTFQCEFSQHYWQAILAASPRPRAQYTPSSGLAPMGPQGNRG